jgi:hypothetical protein
MTNHTPRKQIAVADKDGKEIDAKPLHYIIQNLERTYGTPVNSCPTDPLAMLVQIILLKPRAT